MSDFCVLSDLLFFNVFKINRYKDTKNKSTGVCWVTSYNNLLSQFILYPPTSFGIYLFQVVFFLQQTFVFFTETCPIDSALIFPAKIKPFSIEIKNREMEKRFSLFQRNWFISNCSPQNALSTPWTTQSNRCYRRQKKKEFESVFSISSESRNFLLGIQYEQRNWNNPL